MQCGCKDLASASYKMVIGTQDFSMRKCHLAIGRTLLKAYWMKTGNGRRMRPRRRALWWIITEASFNLATPRNFLKFWKLFNTRLAQL